MIMKEKYSIQNILLADDDLDHVQLFRRILLKEYPEIKIDVVNDGEAVLHYLHLHPVDLLFLDLQMPMRNGYECLQEIRKDRSLRNLPVIVYSSSAHLSDIEKSFINQADFYLVKPFLTEHLKKALEMILSIDWKADNELKGHYYINNRCVPYTAI